MSIKNQHTVEFRQNQLSTNHSENQVVEISDERCQVLRKKASIKSSLIRKTSELQNKENSQIEFKGVWYLPNWNTGLKL